MTKNERMKRESEGGEGGGDTGRMKGDHRGKQGLNSEEMRRREGQKRGAQRGI
jgi:hypothetical protein